MIQQIVNMSAANLATLLERTVEQPIIDAMESKRFLLMECSQITPLIYLLYHVLYTNYQSVGIFYENEATTVSIFSFLKGEYSLLPNWAKHKIVSENKHVMSFENGSRIECRSISSQAMRGRSYNVIYIDEFASFPEERINHFMESVFPVISYSKTTRVFIRKVWSQAGCKLQNNPLWSYIDHK